MERSIYASRRWKNLRLRKLDSTNWKCDRCDRPARECHHRDKRGPPFPTLTGLEALCGWCHRAEHQSPLSRERRAWRQFAQGPL